MYNIVAENPETTVVAEYKPSYRKEISYQSEAELERAFIEQLQNQAYEYLPITTEDELISNLRTQLELLNNYKFSDSEWNQFFKSKIANQNNGIEEKTAIIQEDYIQLLNCDDGTIKNIYLLDKTNIHNNKLQVINQYSSTSPFGSGEDVPSTSSGTERSSGTENVALAEPVSLAEPVALAEPVEAKSSDKSHPLAERSRSHRYDVTILVNGLPLVHIELKKRGVDIKEAFNQINRYSRESFWAGSGLFEYIQLFVITNGTYTKYYSNTTRFTHVKEQNENKIKKGKQTSNSFEFTSWWADGKNQPITDLMDFCRTFFAKHTILSILTKYCVFTAEKLLLAMRPYQIIATEKILNQILVAYNYKAYGSIDAGGFIWHTTGSGKTLTSFKTAQLASKLPFIDKVLFVVDRKDLDYQTMKEYDRFEKGAANSNSNTSTLKKQLEDPNARIIITTIQKLSIIVKKQKNHPSYNKQIVIIFDECHRSQFGDMHTAITKAFKKYYLFGFTGTPIFPKNASSSGKVNLRTTEQAFGKKLHTYTIVNAITDKNVLPFRIDYISTMKEQENIADSKVWDIDREKALSAPERVANIVEYIIKHFDQKTIRNTY